MRRIRNNLNKKNVVRFCAVRAQKSCASVLILVCCIDSGAAVEASYDYTCMDSWHRQIARPVSILHTFFPRSCVGKMF